MPPDSSGIDAALLALLGSDAELLALMPNGVYWEEAPPGSTRFVRVSIADATDEAQFGGRAIEDIVYLIEAVALSTTNADVRGAAARIDVLLEDQPLTAPGYAMMSMARERRVRATEVDPVDLTLRWYHRGGWYRVQMAVSTTSSVWRPHAATHAVGGGDTVNITTLGGYPGGTTKFLRADGQFTVPTGSGGGAGTGDVIGPGASTAGHVATFDDDTGTVLADDGIALSSLVLTTDPRLSNARTPTAHAASHRSGGADAIALDTLAAPTDIATLNASTTAHGLLPKLPGGTTLFLRGDGTFAVPGGGAPALHAATHKSGGSDAIRLDEFAAPLDVTTLNASLTAHGLLPKLPGGTSAFLRADGAFAVPTGTTPSAHAATHAAGGGDAVTITEAQVTNLVADLAGKASTADPRFTDARTPTAHAPSHKSGGSDAIKLDELAAPTDVTTLNASVTAHGLLPKLPGGTGTFLRGDGTFAAPSAAAGPHAATHAVGGGDTVNVATLGGYPGDTDTFLRADGQFVVPPGAGAGGGTVNGPAVSVVGRVATWNNTTGTLLADGGVLLSSLVLTSDARLTDARTPTVHAASHAAAGADPVTITEAQVTGLVADLAGKAATTDPRFTDARTPTAHAASHRSGGSDALALDTLAAPTDITTLDVSTAAHGLAPKLPGTTTTFLRGDGTYATPTGVTPSAHAATHAEGGGDPVTITEAQVTNLVADLAGKASTAHVTTHLAGGSDPLPYLDVPESAPASPPADVARIYGLDVNGFTQLAFLDSAGRSLRFVRDNILVARVSQSGGVTAGQAVYLSGASGANPQIQLAKADAIATMPCIGLTLDAGALNAFVRVLLAGTIAGIDTSAFAEGVALFVSPTVAGGMTITPPPDLTQRVGVVTRSHATQGDILVMTTATKVAPIAHAPSHESGGTDPLPLDLLAPPTDVTTLNASVTAHGLLPKLPGGTTTFLRGDGTYAVPPSGTGTVTGPGTTVVGRVATWNNTTGTLLADGGVLLSSLVLTSDARLSDARTPTAHATSHKSGGADAIKLDELAAPTDITTLNVSTTAHGLAPKLPGTTTTYLRGDGAYASPDVVATLIDGTTPALDASLGSIFRLAAAGDRTIAVPTNPRAGQKIIIQHFASGAGRTLALNTGTNGFRFGSEITALTQTVSGKTDYIGAIWNNTDSKWDVVAYAKGY